MLTYGRWDFDRKTNAYNCPCVREDFECDFGYQVCIRQHTSAYVCCVREDFECDFGYHAC